MKSVLQEESTAQQMRGEPQQRPASKSETRSGA